MLLQNRDGEQNSPAVAVFMNIARTSREAVVFCRGMSIVFPNPKTDYDLVDQLPFILTLVCESFALSQC